MRESWFMTLQTGLNDPAYGVDQVIVNYDGRVRRLGSAGAYYAELTGSGGAAGRKAALVIFTEHASSLRQGVKIDPNGATIPAGTWLTIARNYAYDLGNRIYLVQLAQVSSTLYQVRVGASDNADNFTTSGAINIGTGVWTALEWSWSHSGISLWLETDEDAIPSLAVTAANTLSVNYPCLMVGDTAATIGVGLHVKDWQRKAGDTRVWDYVAPPAANIIFTGAFEGGDESEWTNHTGSGGTVIAGAAQHGTNYGRRCTTTGGNDQYVYKSGLARTDSVYSTRCYIGRPDTLSLPATKHARVMTLKNSSGSILAHANLYYNGSVYKVDCALYDNSGNGQWSSTSAAITASTGYRMEMLMTVGAPGTLAVYLDGVNMASITATNDTRAASVGQFELGITGMDASTSGYLDVDEAKINAGVNRLVGA